MAVRRKKAARRRVMTKARKIKAEMTYYRRIIFGLAVAFGLGLFWKGLWDLARSLTGAESFVIGLGLLIATAFGQKVWF